MNTPTPARKTTIRPTVSKPAITASSINIVGISASVYECRLPIKDVRVIDQDQLKEGSALLRLLFRPGLLHGTDGRQGKGLLEGAANLRHARLVDVVPALVARCGQIDHRGGFG